MNFHGGTLDSSKIDLSASVFHSMHPEAQNVLRLFSFSQKSAVSYPEIDASSLRAFLSRLYSIPAQNIAVGAGSADLIERICSAFSRVLSKKNALILEPAFSEYEHFLELFGFCTKKTLSDEIEKKLENLDKNSCVLDELSDISIVFAANPANPTGKIFSEKAMINLFEQCKKSGAVLILDACFAQFSKKMSDILSVLISRRQEFPNAIILSSFTKFYGMAGLRLGFALCFSQDSPILSRSRPWACGKIELAAGEAILKRELESDEWKNFVRESVQKEKEKIYSFFESKKIDFQKSEANFVLFRSDFPFLKEKLAEKNILIRNCADFFSLGKDFYRVSVKDQKSTDFFLRALDEILFGKKEFSVILPKKARPIMIQGTASNAGKSFLTAALCRIFMQDGFSVSPFKSQNMALNSAVTKDGLEIGTAQALQAAACGLDASEKMNPILLKPTEKGKSQVVVLGKPLGVLSARDYFSLRKTLVPQILSAYDFLAKKSDIVVIEGAGSPAEINLRKNDIVNMGLAELVDSPVLLATDIDKGGAFASLFGTCALLSESEKARIRGFLINRFRGDASLLESATFDLEKMTNIPTLGIVPFAENLCLLGEDSLSDFPPAKKNAPVQIAVVRLPYLSNITDFLNLASLPFVSLEFVSQKNEIDSKKFDILIIPGTKNSFESLDFLEKSGIAESIVEFAKSGIVFGICGGFQILGKTLCDELKIESPSPRFSKGLNLLPIETKFFAEKTVRRADETLPIFSGAFLFFSNIFVSGYEIHHGKSFFENREIRFFSSGNVFGTYIHGFFDSKEILSALFAHLSKIKKCDFGKVEFLQNKIESEINRIAKIVRENCDIEKIYKIIFGEKS